MASSGTDRRWQWRPEQFRFLGVKLPLGQHAGLSERVQLHKLVSLAGEARSRAFLSWMLSLEGRTRIPAWRR